MFRVRAIRLAGAPWPIECFRPLDERQTDISVFTTMLDRVTEEMGAECPLSGVEQKTYTYSELFRV